MPATYQLIASNTLSSAAASVTFSAIPGTYTDIILKSSVRLVTGSIAEWLTIRWNSNAANYSMRLFYSSGASILNEGRAANSDVVYEPPMANGNGSTTNTFSNFEIYLPNYAGSQNKPSSIFGVIEQNSATSGNVSVSASLWSNNSAVSSIYIASQSGGNFVAGSSFFLYGIKNS